MASAKRRARLRGVVAFAMIAAACAPLDPPKTWLDGRTDVRIVMVGDSLVHRSLRDYGMFEALRAGLESRHPGYSVTVVDAGVNGNRIGEILKRLDADVLAERPDAVVLYWDSDISDVDERGMTPAEVRTLRSLYERDLRQVVSRLLKSGAFVVMSGPTVIGERLHGYNKKDHQLDAYRRINRRVAASFGIRYVDTRRAFLAARPAGTPADVSKGLLTEDGEHLNNQGALLAEKMFREVLDGWLHHLPAGAAR